MSKKKAAKGDECVKVCVRVRPLSSKEKQDALVTLAKTGLALKGTPGGTSSSS